MILITINTLRNTQRLGHKLFSRRENARNNPVRCLHMSQISSTKKVSVDTETKEEPTLPNQLDIISSHKYCLAHVRRYDRENYLAALCIKDDLLKRITIALRAFNVELALVRDMTTNSDRAKIRFLFWSKLIEEIIKRNATTTRDLDRDLAYYKHTPIAKELLDIFHLVDIDDVIEGYLKDLVGARLSSKVLGYKPFDDMAELETYCSKSNSSLYHLAWRLDQQLHNVWHMSTDIEPFLNDLASELGVAHGLSNIIRGIPYNSTKNCCYIPKDLLEQHHLTNRDFVTKQLDGIKIRPVIKSLATRCQEILDSVHYNARLIPNHFRHLYLPRVSIQSNLNTLKKCDYNICDIRVSKRNELLPLSLKLSSIYFRAPIL